VPRGCIARSTPPRRSREEPLQAEGIKQPETFNGTCVDKDLSASNSAIVTLTRPRMTPVASNAVVPTITCLASTLLYSANAVQMPVAYGPGVLPPDEQTWQLLWSDDFGDADASVGAGGRWRTSFPSWAGYPPAPFEDANVAVDRNGNGQAYLYAQSADASTVFPPVEESCSCEYRNFTASIIQGTETAPQNAGFVEVRAKLPDAPVRVSIWLQAVGSEIVVFEAIVRASDGSYATEFRAGAHIFDQTQTLDSEQRAVQLSGDAFDLVASFHRYGVAWLDDSVTMYLDGVPQASLQLTGLTEGAVGGYSVNIDVSIDPSTEPAPTDLPVFARIDKAGVWRMEALTNYKQLHGQPICEPTNPGGAKRASIRGLSGPGHTLEACAAGCESTYDCKYFTIRVTGRCYFFEECDITRDHGDSAYVFERITMPEPPEVSPLAGYTLVDAAALTPAGQAVDGVARVCRRNLGASSADRSSLGGGGHDIKSCADACSAQSSCHYFVYTSTGYCKMWFSCGAESTAPQAGSEVYSKDQYRMISLQERCDKNQNAFRSLGGRGWTLQECMDGCEGILACGYFVWYANSGFCHMFTSTCDARVEATDGSQFFERVGGAQIPSLDDFTYVPNEMCDKNGAGNIRTSQFTLGGGGHSFLDCSAACDADATCTMFQRYGSGWCHMWQACPTLKRASRGTLAYTRNAPAPLTIAQIAETIQEHSALAGVASIALGILCGIIVAEVRRRRKVSRVGSYTVLGSADDAVTEHSPLL